MKKRRLIIISLLFALAVLLVLTGCKSGVITIPDDYQSEGYYRVFMYFNGGSGKVDNPYSRYFIDQGGRLPTPMKGSSYEMGMPTRPGYDFYGWYQIDDTRFTSRPQARIKEGQVVYDKNNNVMTEDIWYIKGHDFLNPDLSQSGPQLTPADVEAVDPIFLQTYKDEENEVRVRQWNFDFDRVTQDTTLVAMWRIKRQYVLLPPEYRYEDPDAEDFEQKTGLKKEDCEYDGSILRIARTDTGLISRKGYQIEGFYTDRQFTSAVSFTGRNNRYYPKIDPKTDYKDNGELKTIRIYINWLEERYTIVESSDDLPSTTTNGVRRYSLSGTGYYFLKSDLNLGGNELRAPDIFRGEIEGNGHTIYNFRVDINQNRPTVTQTHATVNYGGVFNKLDGAKIRNVTFDNITYNFYHTDLSEFTNLTRKEYVNVFASEINDYCEVRNVRVGNPDLDNPSAFYYSIFQNVKSYEDYEGYYLNNNFATADGMLLNIPKKYSLPKDSEGNEYKPIIKQLGDNFGPKGVDSQGNDIPYPKEVVSACNANVKEEEWFSQYERYVDNMIDYRNLPKFPDASFLAFYGWFKKETAMKVDITREWTEEDNGIYYAMWVKTA